MSDIKQASGSHQIESTEGHPSFPLAQVQDHEAQPIDSQGKETQQLWRTIAFIMASRAKRYARSFSKGDAGRIHNIIQAASGAYDRAYKGSVDSARGPQHVLIQLFGASGAGTSIARNLTSMIPDVHIVDGDVVSDRDIPASPAPPQGTQDDEHGVQ